MPHLRLSGWMRLALLVLAGAAAALGQAPWGLWPVSLIGFALGIWGIAQTRGPALAGWVFGAAYFAVALNWIVSPFFVEPEVTGWMAPFALLGLAGGLALFWGMAAWGARRFPLGPVGVALALALAEVARATLFTGFPWAQPGHIWIDTPVLHLAATVGPYGLDLLVLLPAAALAMCRPVWGVVAALVWAGALIGGAMMPLAPVAGADAPVVRLVQPNAPQHLKWRPEMVPVFFERGLAATAAVADVAPDVIVWPETALPELLGEAERSQTRLAEAAGDAVIVTGAQYYDASGSPRNTMAVLDASGGIAQVYDKHHLVPFGEYLPLPRIFEVLGFRAMAAQLAGRYAPGRGPRVLEIAPLGRVFPMICYEAIFPGYVRGVTRPAVLLHITNDAWFGRAVGPYQHFALARLRAAEMGVPLLRAANTGISGAVDARGRVIASLGMGQSGHLDVRVPPALPPTVFAKLGHWPVWGVIFIGFAGLFGRARRIGH